MCCDWDFYPSLRPPGMEYEDRRKRFMLSWPFILKCIRQSGAFSVFTENLLVDSSIYCSINLLLEPNEFCNIR